MEGPEVKIFYDPYNGAFAAIHSQGSAHSRIITHYPGGRFIDDIGILVSSILTGKVPAFLHLKFQGANKIITDSRHSKGDQGSGVPSLPVDIIGPVIKISQVIRHPGDVLDTGLFQSFRFKGVEFSCQFSFYGNIKQVFPVITQIRSLDKTDLPGDHDGSGDEHDREYKLKDDQSFPEVYNTGSQSDRAFQAFYRP